MLRLLRVELYRYPRRMTVWAGLAVLLFIAVVNAPGIFAPLRTNHRLILAQAAETLDPILFQIKKDEMWHFGFAQAFSDLNHAWFISIILVGIPLAADFTLRRNDELYAAGYTPWQIYVAKTVAACAVNTVCYVLVLLVSFFVSPDLYSGSISGEEWLVMLKIVGLGVLRLQPFAIVYVAAAFATQKMIASFAVCFVHPFIISFLPKWVPAIGDLFPAKYGNPDAEALVRLFGDAREEWLGAERFLVGYLVVTAALGVAMYIAGFIIYSVRARRRK